MKKGIMAIMLVVSMVSLFAGCSVDLDIPAVHFNGASSGIQDTDKASDDLTVDGKGLKKLNVTNGVGEINLTKTSGEKVEIHYNKEVKGIGDIDAVMDQILVSAKVDGDELSISVRTKEDETKDFWHWLSEHHKGINVSVDFDIKIPEAINDFKLTDGVGDITLNDTKGKVEITDGVGDIKLKSFSLKDECVLTSGTGDVSIEGDIAELSGLAVKSGVGSTTLKLPEDSKFSIDATTGVGKIDGNLISNAEGFVGETLKQDVNGGGAKIQIKSGTGDIKVNKN